ncbi:MAG TPA: CHAT domain-containing protein, partial [Longimicrobiaceae bacterium]|nr:CHAT domain-containing protein [Longimicrobiaceae bacterium]
MHAAALIDLLYERGVGKPLQRSINSLQVVRRLTTRPAPVLSDLAAAYLIRAERASSPRDLLGAIEVTEEALAYEPANRSALFNSALALHRFGLTDDATRRWREYLKVDSTSGWADQARLRLQETLAGAAPPPPPQAEAPPDEYAVYADADPQGARLLGWDRLLGAWAEAVLEGAPAQAEAHLRRAAAIAEALERRSGRDATLADAVRTIRSHGKGAGARRLASAHREYSAGRALYDAVKFRDAEPRFRAAVAAADNSPALQAWARVFLGTTRVQLGEMEEGEAILRAAIAATDADRHPALAARARWSLAGTLLRSDRYEAALEPASEATRLFARAGEREHEGTALQVLADAQFRLHDADAGYLSAHHALVMLRPYRNSVRLHNLLVSIADATSADGLARAAVRVQDEGVEVAGRNGDPIFVAEARLTRARLLTAAGDLARARKDVEAGRAAMRRVTDEIPRRWLEADLRISEAVASLPPDRARAAAALDSAAAFFNGRHIPQRAFPAVVSGAEARLAMGDLAGATARLETAFAMLEQRRDSIGMESRRAAIFNEARGVVDRVAMLKLASGREAEALAYMDRGRASLAPVGPVASGGADGRVEAPPGEVAVEYALVGDTLLAWTVRGRKVALSRTIVDTMRLVHTIDHLRSQLEQQADETAVHDALSRLYEWLVRPVESRLGEAGTPLVVVADDYLASVPFAALHDARKGRYLLEDHPLRFAVSLREAKRGARRSSAPEAAVLISDPAFAPREHPGLQRLEGADGEVRSIAAEYPRSRVLADRQATRATVQAALARAGLVHYAGHAVFDDERPERSYLVLAPTQGRPGSGRLTAGELARLDLE